MEKRLIGYLFFIFSTLGFCTNLQAQSKTNAVLDYPKPIKHVKEKVASTKVIDKKCAKCDTCRKDSSEKKIQKGLNTIGEGMGEFMQRESKAINKITKNVEKGGKKFFKKLSEAGNKLGEGIGKTLNNVSDAISNHQIKNKKKEE